MKKIYLLLMLNIMTFDIWSQVAWAKKGGLWAYDYGYGVVTDVNNNVYVAGKFEMNAIFGPMTASCQGNHDAYIMKYGPDGAEKWLKTAGGADGDYAWGISTDRTNFLYLAGEIEGFTPIVFSGSSITLQGAGDNDVFVSKWDLDGNLIWARREGVITSEKALAVTNDNNGNVYICGYFTGSTNFNGLAVSGYGGRDIFIAKYDAQGTFQWVQKAGGTGRDEAKSIKTDNNGNVYVCGMFSGSASFGSNSVVSGDTYIDSYIAKLSGADGSFQWIKKGAAVLDDVAWSLVLDNAGSIYVTGEFNSYISFQNPSSGLATTGNTNMYVAKFDGSGNVIWIRGGGGSMADLARGIGTDGNTVFLTGQFGGVATFGNITLVAADSSDVFVAAMDANGAFLWGLAGGGPADSYESLGYESGIAVTGNNNTAYATGGMLNNGNSSGAISLDFAGTSLTGYSRVDMFLVAVGSIGLGSPEESVSKQCALRPNPSCGLFQFNSHLPLEQIVISDLSGKIVRVIHLKLDKDVLLDLSTEKDGIYFSSIYASSGEVFHQKIILQH